ncbi:MAG: WD40 repeat domain-containing protein, partial [Saprospiraceae bacterium]
ALPILTGSWDDTAKLWDLSGKELVSFSGQTSAVTSVSFSPDGKTILTGSMDATAKLWDLSGNELVNFSGHTSYVYAVSFSPDGKTILTGSRDKTAKRWLLPQTFLDQKVHKFPLQELYDAGMILDEEDLKKVKIKEKQ